MKFSSLIPQSFHRLFPSFPQRLDDGMGFLTLGWGLFIHNG